MVAVVRLKEQGGEEWCWVTLLQFKASALDPDGGATFPRNGGRDTPPVFSRVGSVASHLLRYPVLADVHADVR